MSNTALEKALALVLDVLGPTADVANVERALHAFFQGDENLRSAAAAVTANVTRALRGFVDGTYTRAEADKALHEARLGARAYVEARVMSLEVEAMERFFNVAEEWLDRLVPRL